MSDILQLRNFWLSRVVMDEPVPPTKGSDVIGRFGIDYDIFRSEHDNRLFRMVLKVMAMAAFSESKKKGPDIEVHAVGEFLVPENLDEAKRDTLARYNGGMILYGMLRGQLAMLTGAFPSGSLLLPTLDWKEVVQKVEREKTAALEAAKAPKPKSARKSTRATTRKGAASAIKKKTAKR